MHPAAKHSVLQCPGTPRRTSQTISSALSACATPNEDLTKISVTLITPRYILDNVLLERDMANAKQT